LKDYCGVPLLLLKALYGYTFSGKFLYGEQEEFLIDFGMQPSPMPAIWRMSIPGGGILLVFSPILGRFLDHKLVKPGIFNYFTLTATNTSSPTLAPRMFLLRKQLTSCLSLKFLSLRKVRLSPRPVQLQLRLFPWLNRRWVSGILMESRKLVSGILMESRKLVTLCLTLLKLMLCPRNDSPVLARFHSHWTRQLVEFPRSITIVPPRFNFL